MLRAYINGIEYPLQNNYSIVEKVGNQTSTDITVLVNNQNPFPVSGDIIQIIDDTDDTAIFYGSCGIPKSPTYSSIYDQHIYQITCGNGNSILNNRIANVAMQNVTITQIVRRHFDLYIASEGITLGFISDIAIILEVYTASNWNLRETLNELANLVNAVWEITPDKVFNFYVFDELPRFPETVDHTYLDLAELQYATKSYNLRTVQHISGATDVTDPQTEEFIYDGEQRVFSTVFPLSSKPQIWVNGVEINPNRIGVQGFNSDDDDIIFLFSHQSRNVNYVERSEYLTAGDRVTIRYIGIFSIRVSVSNTQKVNEIATKTGTSGIIERVQIANTVRTSIDAVNLALSLLNQFEEKEGHISFWMNSDHINALGYNIDVTKPMTMFTFNLPEIGIAGEYVVSERALSPIRPSTDTETGSHKVSLKLVDRNILQSYGQIIRNMAADIVQLSIRPDEIVVSTEIISETCTFGEEYIFGQSLQYYVSETLGIDGSLAVPSDLGQQIYTT